MSLYATTETRATTDDAAALAAGRYLAAILSNRVTRTWFAAQRGQPVDVLTQAESILDAAGFARQSKGSRP